MATIEVYSERMKWSLRMGARYPSELFPDTFSKNFR